MKITKNTLIGDVIKGNFVSTFVFHKYGMSCYQCSNRFEETLEYGAMHHNVDINLLLDDLNKLNFP